MREKNSDKKKKTTDKFIKAPKNSGFYLLEIPPNHGRDIPLANGKPSVPLRMIRQAMRKVAKEREQLLVQYKLAHAKSK